MTSTFSGSNAMLFGTSRLVHTIAAEGSLPQALSFRTRENISVYVLVAIRVAGRALRHRNAQADHEFGSMTLLIADAITTYTNLRLADEAGLP